MDSDINAQKGIQQELAERADKQHASRTSAKYIK